ncbi:MAG: Ig-like domain-containing protein [Myxococcota bacterium]
MRVPLTAVSLLLVACGGAPAELDDPGADETEFEIEPPTVDDTLPPVLELRPLEIQEDTAGIGVLIAADPEGGPIRWRVADLPRHGRLDLDAVGGTYVYTPDPDYYGDDVFGLTVFDEKNAMASGVVDVRILPDNDAPVAQDLGPLFVRTGGTLASRLVGLDVDGDALTWSLTTDAQGGEVVVEPLTGDFVYTPDDGFEGVDSFSVVASDGALQSELGVVTLEVFANEAPVLVGMGPLVTAEDQIVTSNVVGFDPDGDPMLFIVATPPLHGSVTLSGVTGAFAYTPAPDFNGADEFELVATDGILDSAPLVVDVEVTPVNDAPYIVPAPLTVTAGQTGSVVLDVVDPEGDATVLTIVVAPQHGSASIDPGPDTLSYTPDDGYTGPDTLVVAASDGLLTSQRVIPIDVL